MVLDSLPVRLQRLRKTAAIRQMLQETRLNINDFIVPLFIKESLQTKQSIVSLPGYFQLSLNEIAAEIDALSALGVRALILFGIPAHKDLTGSASLSVDGIIQQAIRIIKQINPDLVIIADVCLCEYTSHGHCGIIKNSTIIDNDQTLHVLAQQAVSYAQAGADWIAPSSMTDGMVAAIRKSLDKFGHSDVAILSYAVKYSSSLYGPFREAAQGPPTFGDRQSYQMDPANGNEAMREARLDIDEGTDLLMVKPAMFYLDIIYRIKTKYPEIPLCAYQVSGEYAMIKNLAQQSWANPIDIMLESLLAIKRAGANLIISYFAKEFANLDRSYI